MLMWLAWAVVIALMVGRAADFARNRAEKRAKSRRVNAPGARGATEGRCTHNWAQIQNCTRGQLLCSECKLRIALARHDAGVASLVHTRAIIAEILAQGELSREQNER